jgi:hypothetical protein
MAALVHEAHRSSVEKEEEVVGGLIMGYERAAQRSSQASDEETRWQKGQLVDVTFGQRRGETKGVSERGDSWGRSRRLL